MKDEQFGEQTVLSVYLEARDSMTFIGFNSCLRLFLNLLRQFLRQKLEIKSHGR